LPLELGVDEKLDRGWDYALVLVPNELIARQRTYTIAVPSSALETAVLSLAGLDYDGDVPAPLVGLALHELGHLWGLAHDGGGLMTPREELTDFTPEDLTPAQQAVIVDRLEEVTDQRLEERRRRWSPLLFAWRTFLADPRSILSDIWGYRPWRLPLQAGRLTAATAISILFLLLTAEAWEAGSHTGGLQLGLGAIVSIAIATLFLFQGQHLGQVSRGERRREQLTRTRIITLGTLLLGMVALYVLLFVIGLVAGLLLPSAILDRWVGPRGIGGGLLVRQAAFTASLGVLAGALGGNLENEDDLKAQLYFDEES
jgi:hypothetical protein